MKPKRLFFFLWVGYQQASNKQPTSNQQATNKQPTNDQQTTNKRPTNGKPTTRKRQTEPPPLEYFTIHKNSRVEAQRVRTDAEHLPASEPAKTAQYPS